MSFFDNPRFQYRETYLVFFPAAARPDVAAMQAALAGCGTRLEISAMRSENNLFESVSVEAPEDNVGMDIAFFDGNEVRQQVRELLQEFRTITLSGDDAQRLAQLRNCDARFDILLFEPAGNGEDDLDPGGLLLVVERLCGLTGGIGVDPQSMSFL